MQGKRLSYAADETALGEVRGAKSQETQSWRSLQRGKCCHVASMSVMAWCMLCRLLQRRCGGTCFIPFPGICEHEGTELISVESILSL